MVDIRKACVKPISCLKNDKYLLKMKNILLTMVDSVFSIISIIKWALHWVSSTGNPSSQKTVLISSLKEFVLADFYLFSWITST